MSTTALAVEVDTREVPPDEVVQFGRAYGPVRTADGVDGWVADGGHGRLLRWMSRLSA